MKPVNTLNFVVKNDFNVGGGMESKKEKDNRPQRKKKHKKDLRNDTE